MPLSALSPVLSAANARGGYAMGLVCLNWEDAEAFVAAGDAAQVPVILQAGPGARRHMPVALWGAMFRELGQHASVPVVAHLDHGQSFEDCAEALEAGFTSVMFDGSAMPLEDNVSITRQVVEMASTFGASVEAEVGVVGYAAGQASHGTSPEDARAMTALGIDALAVSVGNVHLQQDHGAQIDWDLAKELAEIVRQPLVIHGGSGVPPDARTLLSRHCRVAKINVGTELRQIYGAELRRVLADDPGLYDRLGIARAVRPGLIDAAARMMRAAWL